MSESREAPEAPQVVTLENPNELPAASREEATAPLEEHAEAAEELPQLQTQPQTLENPHEPGPSVDEPAGMLDEAPPVGPVAAEELPPLQPQTLENPHEAGPSVDEPAGTLADAPPVVHVAGVSSPAVDIRTPLVAVPAKTRTRTSFWYSGDTLLCELVLMDAKRNLLVRDTFEVHPGSPFWRVHEVLRSSAAQRARDSGRLAPTANLPELSVSQRAELAASLVIDNANPPPDSQE